MISGIAKAFIAPNRKVVTRIYLLVLLILLAQVYVGWFSPLMNQPFGELMKQLFVEFGSLIAGVFIVERIVEKIRESQWDTIDLAIRLRVQRVSNIAAAGMREGFKFPDQYVTGDLKSVPDYTTLLQNQIVAHYEHYIPLVEPTIRTLRKSDWEKIKSKLEKARQIGEDIMRDFGSRIRPESLAMLIDMVDAIDNVLSVYAASPQTFDADETALEYANGATLQQVREYVYPLMSDACKKVLSESAKSSAALLTLEQRVEIPNLRS